MLKALYLQGETTLNHPEGWHNSFLPKTDKIMTSNKKVELPLNPLLPSLLLFKNI